MKARSLYLHFPFCESRCHYCDFYALALDRTDLKERDAFSKTLRAELLLRKESLAPALDTIFCGGGTPSLTTLSDFQWIFEPLLESGQISSQTEWTTEANPSSIERPLIEGLRKLGVNRVSMGVQALDDELLKKLGRVHSKEKALTALSTVFEAGIENVSVDLLCGVPGQSHEHIERAISQFAKFPITHLSCYLLTLAPHHPMYRDLPNEDTQLEHLMLVHQLLSDAGFEHYEISNYARAGRFAQHNLNYWKGQSYLGLGPSAHSFDQATSQRFKNVSSLKKYLEIVGNGEFPTEWTETLTSEQLELEKWMLNLRLNEGFPKAWLDSRKALKSSFLLEKGLLEEHPENAAHLRLTPRGLALSDQVIKELALA